MTKAEREARLNDAVEHLKKHGSDEEIEKAINDLKAIKTQVHESTEKVKYKIDRAKILRNVIRQTRTYKLLAIFLVLFFILAGILWLVEPGITSYADSLWLCYAAATTTGFGDISAATLIGRICVVILSLYAIILTAIITSVIVAYHNQVLEVQRHEELLRILEKSK